MDAVVDAVVDAAAGSAVGTGAAVAWLWGFWTAGRGGATVAAAPSVLNAVAIITAAAMTVRRNATCNLTSLTCHSDFA
uniref:Uncharacterized protein n=1 Tax=Nonomuraea gerenzanensis TaxID=93944 RepID=A0A1M4DVH0_9ACTN|nr:hypothetical protein BN4615_P55 [Nonomuraea gerenzanensis]